MPFVNELFVIGIIKCECLTLCSLCYTITCSRSVLWYQKNGLNVASSSSNCDIMIIRQSVDITHCIKQSTVSSLIISSKGPGFHSSHQTIRRACQHSLHHTKIQCNHIKQLCRHIKQSVVSSLITSKRRVITSNNILCHHSLHQTWK